MPKIKRFIFVILKIHVFKTPFRVLTAYITKNSKGIKSISMWNGIVIYLSDNCDDVSTVIGQFLINDYGTINKNAVVIDIGANIGVFSIYAGLKHNIKVYAFEPEVNSFIDLAKTIKLNKT